MISSKDASQYPYPGKAHSTHETQKFTHIEGLTNRMGQGYPSNLASKKVGVYTTEVELGAFGSKLDSEHGTAQYTL